MRFSFSQPLPVTKRTPSVSKARYWPSKPTLSQGGSQETTPGSFSQQRSHVTAAGTLNDATYCTQPSDYEPYIAAAQPTPPRRPPQPGPLQPLGRQPLQTVPLRQRMAALQGPTQHSCIVTTTPSSAHPAPLDSTMSPAPPSKPGKGSRIAARLLTELAQRNQTEGPTQDDDATQATQDMDQMPGCFQDPAMDATMRTLLEDAVVSPLVQHATERQQDLQRAISEASASLEPALTQQATLLDKLAGEVAANQQELASELRRPPTTTVACQTTPLKAAVAACQTSPVHAVHQGCQTMQHAAVPVSCQTTPVKAVAQGCAPTALAQLLGAAEAHPGKRVADGAACGQDCKRARTLVDEREVQQHLQQQLLRARVSALVQALHTCV